MSWLTPLGFLGLLGIAVLVIIYIIKPNYQNKHISSTYIWRMSLKYKKQRIPISKIQNLLTFICQVLILSILGTMLAGPVLAAASGVDRGEVVLVVDAGAGMRMTDSGKTRFRRAMELASDKAEEAFSRGSSVSLIIADDAPEFEFSRRSSAFMRDTLDKMGELAGLDTERCIWSAADVDGAVKLAESVVEVNSGASVYLFTATDYTHHPGVNIVDVSSEGEWNATVLDCKTEADTDGEYEITVKAAVYGKTGERTVFCTVNGVNGDPSRSVSGEKKSFFDPSAEEREIVFTSGDFDIDHIYSYESVVAYVVEQDSLPDDNSFSLYDGVRPTVRIQYASSSPNNFFDSAVRALRQMKRGAFDIEFVPLASDEPYEIEGFDIYIFEHKMPDYLPEDGVVLLVDPDTAPVGSGLNIGGAYRVDKSSSLAAGAQHSLTEYVDPERITISKYNDIVLSEDYEELMFYNGRPVMLLKDTPESRILVWAFDLNYSNLIALPDFSFLVYNMFDYFIPETFSENSYEIGDTVSLSGRGGALTVGVGDTEYFFGEGEGELTLAEPGVYSVGQQVGLADYLLEYFFVRMPEEESNTAKRIESLTPVVAPEPEGVEYNDLILYFSIALVTLMFAEWVLEIKKNY